MGHKKNRHRSRSPRDSKTKPSSGGSYHYPSASRHEGRPDDTIKNIQGVRDRLKSGLNSAISEFAQSSQPDKSDFEDKSKVLIRNSEIDILESVNRQAEIDRIEEEGFKPQTFYSKTYNSKSAKTNSDKNDAKQKDHDRAMFGSMWQGKELEKKQLHNISYKEQEKKTPVTDRIHEKDDSRTDDNFLYQLVHERLSEKQDDREKRWLKLFIERRRQALEGTLI